MIDRTEHEARTSPEIPYGLAVMLWTGVAATIYSLLDWALPYEGLALVAYVAVGLVVGLGIVVKAEQYLQSDRLLP